MRILKWTAPSPNLGVEMALHPDIAFVINTIRGEITDADFTSAPLLTSLIESYLATISNYIMPTVAWDGAVSKILASTIALQASLAHSREGTETQQIGFIRSDALRALDAFSAVVEVSEPSEKAIRLGMSWVREASRRV